jgi:hypothetical protein
MTADPLDQQLAGQTEPVSEPGLSKRLFSDRPSASVDQEIMEIRRILDGKTETLHLSESEKQELREFESPLGAEMEQAVAMKARSETFILPYFFTEAGQTEFAKLFPGTVMPEDEDSLRKFFYLKIRELSMMDEKTLENLSATARNFAEQKNESQILSSLNDQGDIVLENIDYPSAAKLVFDPQLTLTKLKKLRSIKKSLLKQKREFVPPFSDAVKAKRAILKMYLARLNEQLANFYSSLLKLQGKAEKIGEENLDPAEREILTLIWGKKNRPRTQAMLDKFVFGTSRDLDERGDYNQISGEIEAKVMSALDSNRDFAVVQRNSILSQGLDPEKILAENITPEQRKKWGDQVLDRYGLLSSENSGTYLKSQNTPPPDNKWRYVLRPDRKTLAVNQKQKVVLDSDHTNRDLIKSLLVAVGHEIEGHVLQHENKAKIPLRLFKSVGGDRGHLMSEGGAVYNEDQLIQQILGYHRPVATYYLCAMKRKQQGGDFLDCLKSAYSVEISRIRAKYNLNDAVEKEKFLEEARKTVKMLLPRIRRIFSGVDLADRSGYLPNTKDTVYLEQDILMEKLAAAGLEKLAFLGAINLRNIATLLRIGLLKYEDIMEPKYYTKEIWGQIKHQYQIENQENIPGNSISVSEEQ